MSDAIRDAVRSDLLAQSADWCATKWLLETPPHIFSDFGPSLYWNWKSEIATRLSVDPRNIVITGSSAVGVSLSPNKNLRSFGINSDIDVAVISTYHFDIAWRTLRNLGTKRYSLTPAQRNAVHEHVNRFIYWGTIATDRILPILPFVDDWMNAANEMSKVEPTKDRDIKFRIYRDFSSLRAYMNMGIETLQGKLIGVSESTDIAIN